MDALMVVHQLQRLAAEPRPSATVRGRIPRMAVGICYFLEHPDVVVKHQAAGALRLLVHQHAALLAAAPEASELEAAVRSHAVPSASGATEDAVVREACEACLLALQREAAAAAAAALSLPDAATEGGGLAKSAPSGEPASQLADKCDGGGGLAGASQTGGPEAVKREEPQKQSEDGFTATAATASEEEERKESLDLYSVVLGLRGLLDAPANRSLLARCSASSSEKSAGDAGAADHERRASLELLQRDLQLRLVRVWGVSSATVTLNAEALLAEASLRSSALVGDASEGAAAKCEEGDGVAVVLMRLSKKPEKLQRQLRALRAAVGPLTLLLKSHIVQRASQATARDSEENLSLAQKPRAAEGSRRTKAVSAQVSPVFLKEGAASSPLPASDSGYLDEELSQDTGDASSGGNKAQQSSSSATPDAEDGLAGRRPAATGGFSFFSSNSALFAQSRFMGGMLRPTDTDSDMSARLKAEKERKARLRAQQQEGGIISKLVSRLGSGANLL